MQKTMLVISGPSGVGKRPFLEALGKCITLREVLVRVQFAIGMTLPGVQRIRTDDLPAIQPPRFLTDDVRGQLNAVDMDELGVALAENELVVVMPHYTLAQMLLEDGRIRARVIAGDLRIITVFLSPFSEREIRACNHPHLILTPIMAGRQLQRALDEAVGGHRSQRMVQPSEVAGANDRTSTIIAEIEARGWFDYRFTLRDGYLPTTWKSDPPSGDAGIALQKLISILQSE